MSVILSYRFGKELKSARVEPIYYDAERHRWCACARDTLVAAEGDTIQSALDKLAFNLMEKDFNALKARMLEPTP